jgi:hypothetical protein
MLSAKIIFVCLVKSARGLSMPKKSLGPLFYTNLFSFHHIKLMESHPFTSHSIYLFTKWTFYCSNEARSLLSRMATSHKVSETWQLWCTWQKSTQPNKIVAGDGDIRPTLTNGQYFLTSDTGVLLSRQSAAYIFIQYFVSNKAHDVAFECCW